MFITLVFGQLLTTSSQVVLFHPDFEMRSVERVAMHAWGDTVTERAAVNFV